MAYDLMELLESRRLFAIVAPVAIMIPVDRVPVDPPIIISDPLPTEGSTPMDPVLDPVTDPTLNGTCDGSTDVTGDGNTVTAPTNDSTTVPGIDPSTGTDPAMDPVFINMDGGIETMAAGVPIRYSKRDNAAPVPSGTAKSPHHVKTHVRKNSPRVHAVAPGHPFNTVHRIAARIRRDMSE